MTFQTASDHQLAVAATRPAPPQTGATSSAAPALHAASWPFHPDDVTPLQWWRTLPADRLTDAQHLLLRSTLAKISPLRGREWLGGLRGDAAAGIALALESLPITAVTIEIDLVMSALAVHALSGNAAAALVLSHVLRLAPLDHPFGRELSASWLALNLRHAMQRKTMDVAKADAAQARRALDRCSFECRAPRRGSHHPLRPHEAPCTGDRA